MDHTPGQGQYRNIEAQRNFYLIRGEMSEQETDAFLEYLKTLPKLDTDKLQAIGNLAWDHGIPVASHDDDSVGKLDLMQEWKASICEFPVDLEVAIEAKRRGMHTVMGAPNVLLGKSHSNNLSALDAISHDAVDILCSDYHPPSMLQAAFLLVDKGLKSLPEAIRLVTLNPAIALGLGHELGSIESGKTADLLLVKMVDGRPLVDRTFVQGELIMQMNYALNQSKLLSLNS
jgi:alpha-D-ribose 1-methylphosphonate 5-triphosphate diphosphatase